MSAASQARCSGLLHGATLLALGVVAASVTVRLTVRDRVAWLDLFHYGTPPVVCAVVAAAAAALAWRLRRRRTAASGAALAVGCGVLYASGSFVFGNDVGSPGALRGVFWNVGHGSGGWPRVAETLRRLDPDVAWLAESDDGVEGDDLLRAALPGRELQRGGGGMAILSRGTTHLVRLERLVGRGRAAHFELNLQGRAFTTLFVDMANGPGRRGPSFATVEELAAPLAARPLLVLGDFNTPRDSELLDGLRAQGLAHAFETAGSGLDATWPVPLPVLSIDHVWAGGGIVVRTCELPWASASDHLPVVFTFDVP